MAVEAEAKAGVARTGDVTAVAATATTPAVAVEAPIGHTAITGMSHARGTMGNVVKAMDFQSTRPRPFHHVND